jgi:hypothetical protein
VAWEGCRGRVIWRGRERGRDIWRGRDVEGE